MCHARFGCKPSVFSLRDSHARGWLPLNAAEICGSTILASGVLQRSCCETDGEAGRATFDMGWGVHALHFFTTDISLDCLKRRREIHPWDKNESMFPRGDR